MNSYHRFRYQNSLAQQIDSQRGDNNDNLEPSEEKKIKPLEAMDVDTLINFFKQHSCELTEKYGTLKTFDKAIRKIVTKKLTIT